MTDEKGSVAEYQQKIEAILFAAGYPVTYEKLAEVLELTPGAVKKLVQAQAQCYHDNVTHGIELLAYDTACQLCTKAEHEEIIKKALGIKKGAGTLSNSSLEVLAIIAYHQPVTRAYIEQIRGVDSSYHVGSLTDKGLIEPKGRLDVPGKPILFGTTKDFLRAFGIASLAELPSLDLFAAADIVPQQQTFDIEMPPEQSEEEPPAQP